MQRSVTTGSELESYLSKFVKEYARISVEEPSLHKCLSRDISPLEEESYSEADPLENSIANGQDILDRNHINLEDSEWDGGTVRRADFQNCPRRN